MSLTAENTPVIEVPLEATPLAGLFPAGDRIAYRGALTPRSFSSRQEELQALTSSAGLYDLGYLSALKITGEDRVRWLNGMVTNTVRSLEPGHLNYNFLLNAQGRILGDCTAWNFDDSLLLQSDRAQIASIAAHLDRFIIMDDVELQPLDASSTAIGLAGPSAPEILARLGLPIPPSGAFMAAFHGAHVVVAAVGEFSVPRFQITLPVASLEATWKALAEAGAVPCGTEAVEALRILEGTPLYGVDILSTHLPQETAQAKALNFDKGCYLGQEIVERIRSRATIHRTFRQLALSGDLPPIEPGQPAGVTAEASQRNPVGEITSAASFHLAAFTGTVALGFIRTEVLERKLAMTCRELAIEPLDRPPLP